MEKINKIFELAKEMLAETPENKELQEIINLIKSHWYICDRCGKLVDVGNKHDSGKIFCDECDKLLIDSVSWKYAIIENILEKITETEFNSEKPKKISNDFVFDDYYFDYTISVTYYNKNMTGNPQLDNYHVELEFYRMTILENENFDNIIYSLGQNTNNDLIDIYEIKMYICNEL